MRSLIAVLFLALPVIAQQTAPKPKVVVVKPDATSRPAPPTKIVRVAPTTRTAPAGAYDGTRPHRDWKYSATRGPARARASYRIWRSRFRPVHPFRSVPMVYRYHR